MRLAGITHRFVRMSFISRQPSPDSLGTEHPDTATEAVGVPTVYGKAALRDYLVRVLRPVTALRFTIHRVIWDRETSELSIIYDREINGQRDRASEILHFAGSGRVDRGEVYYGVIPQVART